MDIRVEINGLSNDIKLLARQRLNAQIDKLVLEKLGEMNLDKLIEERVTYLIDRSKYVSDSVIRNLVQQRIAKEITIKLLANG